MELGKSLNDCPDTILMQIIAISQLPDKQSLCLVNRRLLVLASKKNIDNLLQWPCVLSRKDHLDCMVRYGKNYLEAAVIKNDEQKKKVQGNELYKMNLAIKSASLCSHKNAVSVTLLFINTYPIFNSLYSYKKNPNDQLLQSLLPTIMHVYGGHPETYKIYKNQYSNYQKYSALHIAVYCRQWSIARLFLAQEKQGIVSWSSLMRRTPLYIAIRNRDVRMVKILCEHPYVDVNAQLSSGYTPLFMAVQLKQNQYKNNDDSDRCTIIKTLLKAKANPNIAAETSLITPFLAAVCYSLKKEVIIFFLQHGALIDTKDKDNNTALIVAVNNNDYDMIQLLLTFNADINITNKKRETALHRAVEKHNIKAVSLLCKHNASLEIKNNEGLSPLMLAIYKNNYLINMRQIYNRAAYEFGDHLFESYEIIKLLLAKGADPNVRNLDGDTPLIYAAQCGNRTVVQSLLQYNVCLDIQNIHGEDVFSATTDNVIKKMLKKDKKLKSKWEQEDIKQIKNDKCIIS